MRPLFVVCDGGYRTGSTVAYNIVREILTLRGIAHAGGLRSDPAEIDAEVQAFGSGRRSWAVLKSHVWTPAAPRRWMRLIYTTRDHLDVAASLRRHRDTWEEVLADVQRQAEMDALHRSPTFVEQHRPLLLDYAYYYHRPDERVEMIGRHLGLPLAEWEVALILSRTSLTLAVAIQNGLAPRTQDPETLIQADHVGEHGGQPGHGRTILGPEGVESVEAALGACGATP